MIEIGIIDYALDECNAKEYAMQLPAHSAGEVKVCYAYALKDAVDGMSTDQWCHQYGVKRVDSISELTMVSDAILILSEEHPEFHEKLCQIPLASGKPCFVAMPFASDGKIAERIFRNAELRNTPCYSASVLRYAEQYRTFELDEVTDICCYAPYSLEEIVPVLDTIMMVIRSTPKRVRVQMRNEEHYILSIQFADGRVATVEKNSDIPFMNIKTRTGEKEIRFKKKSIEEFVKEMVCFFRTRRVPVSHQETIYVVDVWDAALLAASVPGQWIEVGIR